MPTVVNELDMTYGLQVIKTFSMRKLVAYRIGRQLWCKKEGNKGLNVILYRLGTTEKSHSSQQRKIRHIHGGVAKAVGIHSTPLPLSSIKIHLVKGSPDRSYESSKVAL